MDDLTKEFLIESYENLDRVDRDFVELEKNPSKEILGNIFRAIHTIKGTCGFLGFAHLESMTHAGENLLSLLRDGSLQVNKPVADALLAMVDAVREMLPNIETVGNEGERDDSALIETLHALQRGAAPPVGQGGGAEESPGPLLELTETAADATRVSRETLDPCIAASAPGKKFGEMLVQTGQASQEQVERALQEQAKGDPRRLGEILVQQGAVKPGTVLETIRSQREAKAAVSDSTVRVDVRVLEKLVNLVGELVLSRNQIMQFAAGQEDSDFLAASQHLSLVTSELQEAIMKTRMQPIGNLWNMFPRVVRDLAAACNKRIRVEMEGAETELDRTIIEAIKDPLTHVLRNSVDHGIEAPEARTAAGKPAEGRLFLRAFHEGGQVNIEISDDGGGIDPEKVRDKAVRKGLISPEHAARLSDRELINLIFLAGFSTAEEVTNVSGRGVGMDVVKTNIEKIGGAVDVQSQEGHGTSLKVKIPLTLAIIPALMVTTGGDRYAVPQVNLLELVRLEGDRARGVEMVHGAAVYRLRGNLLPLVFLRRELKLTSRPQTEESSVNIVVLQADGRQFGLIVDEINDSKDIVVKPLGKHLKGIPTFSGATILGDGKVALILSVNGIAQSASVVSEVRKSGTDEISMAKDNTGELQPLLLCRHSGKKGGQVGIPLALVARLEEFCVADIERSGAREVVQYRGEIMPLIRLSQALGTVGEPENKDSIQVVVYREHGRSVGLAVDQIADIVEERLIVRGESPGSHFMATAVIQGRVTDILDVRAVIESANPDYLTRHAAAQA